MVLFYWTVLLIELYYKQPGVKRYGLAVDHFAANRCAVPTGKRRTILWVVDIHIYCWCSNKDKKLWKVLRCAW